MRQSILFLFCLLFFDPCFADGDTVTIITNYSQYLQAAKSELTQKGIDYQNVVSIPVYCLAKKDTSFYTNKSGLIDFIDFSYTGNQQIEYTIQNDKKIEFKSNLNHKCVTGWDFYETSSFLSKSNKLPSVDTDNFIFKIVGFKGFWIIKNGLLFKVFQQKRKFRYIKGEVFICSYFDVEYVNELIEDRILEGRLFSKNVVCNSNQEIIVVKM